MHVCVGVGGWTDDEQWGRDCCGNTAVVWSLHISSHYSSTTECNLPLWVKHYLKQRVVLESLISYPYGRHESSAKVKSKPLDHPLVSGNTDNKPLPHPCQQMGQRPHNKPKEHVQKYFPKIIFLTLVILITLMHACVFIFASVNFRSLIWRNKKGAKCHDWKSWLRTVLWFHCQIVAAQSLRLNETSGARAALTFAQREEVGCTVSFYLCQLIEFDNHIIQVETFPLVV